MVDACYLRGPAQEICLMKRSRSLLPALVVAAATAGCASAPAEKKDPIVPEIVDVKPRAPPPGVTACEEKGQKPITIDVNKDGKADVWKYMQTVEEQGTKVDVLVCKEVDLNYDGNKDMWVHYDSQGNVTLEEFDLD